MAIATVTIPSALFLAPFSSREAALLKSRAHKRTRIDKEKKNKETEEPFALWLQAKGDEGVVGISRPPQKPKFQT